MTRSNLRVSFLTMTILVSGLAGLAILAAAPPKFDDFPVADVFKGKPAAPLLSTPQARRFRTQLRLQAASGPDFAGHFKLARWGCGAGCVFVAVIDSVSGEVYFAPFGFQDGVLTLDGGRRTVKCDHTSDYRIDSELFIFQGLLREGAIEGKAGTHYYRWHDRKWTLVHYEPACPALQQ